MVADPPQTARSPMSQEPENDVCTDIRPANDYCSQPAILEEGEVFPLARVVSTPATIQIVSR